jgi:hypothetical protein
MSAGMWLAFSAVLYGLGIPIVGAVIAREANRMIATGQIPAIQSNRLYRTIVGVFAIGWPAIVLYFVAVKVIVLYTNAQGIDLNKDDDDPPPGGTPNGAT